MKKNVAKILKWVNGRAKTNPQSYMYISLIHEAVGKKLLDEFILKHYIQEMIFCIGHWMNGTNSTTVSNSKFQIVAT